MLSTLPAFWGTELEAQIVAGFATAAPPDGPKAMRLLLSTTAHCLEAEEMLGSIGLERSLDQRPVLFKELA